MSTGTRSLWKVSRSEFFVILSLILGGFSAILFIDIAITSEIAFDLLAFNGLMATFWLGYALYTYRHPTSIRNGTDPAPIWWYQTIGVIIAIICLGILIAILVL